MRIDGPNSPRRIELCRKRDAQPSGSDGAVAKSDSVSISDRAQKASRAYKLVSLYQELPDVRPARLAEVRTRMERGDYFTRQVAEETAEEILLDSQ